MKIYIDVSVLTLATYITGIQRATIEIATRLIKRPDCEVIPIYYNASKNSFFKINNEMFADFYSANKGKKEKMITKEAVSLADMGAGSIFFDLDGAWMGHVKRSYLLPILKSQGCKIVAHIYDIISITHPQYCEERGVYNFMDYIGAHLKYADQIIVNAHATVRELELLCKQIGCTLSNCEVVYLGADFKNRDDKEATANKELEKIMKSRPYILMVGTLEPRKNHKLMIRAYENGLKELEYNIIFAGYMGWNMEEFASGLKEHPDYDKRIFHLQGLNDEDISGLYRNAKFLAFCSYMEGFGLPIIEALQRGTPVIAADVPVLREVGKDFCLWFEQDNPKEICDLVKSYEEKPEAYRSYKERLKEYKATGWDDTIEKVYCCLQQCLNRKRND